MQLGPSSIDGPSDLSALRDSLLGGHQVLSKTSDYRAKIQSQVEEAIKSGSTQ